MFTLESQTQASLTSRTFWYHQKRGKLLCIEITLKKKHFRKHPVIADTAIVDFRSMRKRSTIRLNSHSQQWGRVGLDTAARSTCLWVSQIRKQNVDWLSRSWVKRSRITEIIKILSKKITIGGLFTLGHWERDVAIGRAWETPATLRPLVVKRLF